MILVLAQGGAEGLGRMSCSSGQTSVLCSQEVLHNAVSNTFVLIQPYLQRLCYSVLHSDRAACDLQELKDKHREVMTEMLMDVLRALTAPNMDIRKKTLDISLDLITQRNIDEVVQVLKKEVMKTQSKELEKGAEYRQLLVQVWLF